MRNHRQKLEFLIVRCFRIPAGLQFSCQQAHIVDGDDGLIHQTAHMMKVIHVDLIRWVWKCKKSNPYHSSPATKGRITGFVYANRHTACAQIQATPLLIGYLANLENI